MGSAKSLATMFFASILVVIIIFIKFSFFPSQSVYVSVFQEPETYVLPAKNETSATATTTTTKYKTIRQDEVELWYLKGMVRRAKMGSVEREEAKKQLDDVISHRKHVDQSVIAIVRVMVDDSHGQSQVLKGSTETDTWDWKCLKGMLASYQAQCGTLRMYGMKYIDVFAKLCNFDISPEHLGVAARQICPPHSVKPQWMAAKKVGFYEYPYMSTNT